MKLINRRYVFASVEDCRYTNYSTFYLSLPELETEPHLEHRLFVNKMILPYNWKSVDSTNNRFTVGGVDYTLTEGNPNIIDLLDDINDKQNYLFASFNRITSKVSFSNVSASSKTLNTNCYKPLGMDTSTPTINAGAIYTAPNIVDVRPKPIVEIHVDTGTAGQEIYNGGEIKNTGVLAAIGMDVSVYSHKIWIDRDAMFWANITNQNREIRVDIRDTDGNNIIPQTSPYFVFGINTYRDDERQLLQTQEEALKLMRYDLLLKDTQAELPAPVPSNEWNRYALTGADIGEQVISPYQQ